MPAIHAKALLTLIESIGSNHLGQSQEGGRVDTVLALGMLKVPGASKVVFRSRSADRGPILVAIEVKLDFAFTPPTVVVDAPGDISTYIMSMALDVM